MPWYVISFKVLLTIWLIVVSVWDSVERRIPNAFTLPVMLAGLIWQIYLSISQHTWAFGTVLIVWVVAFAIWQRSIIGGGDAKVVMGLAALFPDEYFLLRFCAGVLVCLVAVLIVKAAKRLIKWLRGEASAGIDLSLPTREKLQTEGKSFVWVFTLPALVYTWCFGTGWFG